MEELKATARIFIKKALKNIEMVDEIITHIFNNIPNEEFAKKLTSKIYNIITLLKEIEDEH